MRPLLDLNGVAERLGVRRTMVYRLRKNDPTFPLPIFLTTAAPRFDPDEIDAWVESKRASLDTAIRASRQPRSTDDGEAALEAAADAP